MLRTPLLIAARSGTCKAVVEHTPVTRRLVSRYVAGSTVEQALPIVEELTRDRYVTLDHLGEDVTDAGRAEKTVTAYTHLLEELARSGLGPRAEVSVKLSAVGQSLPVDGDKIALENAWRICAAANEAGTTVTLDMEDHTTTDSTLSILRELRVDYPSVGAVLQAYLHRTESDCRDLRSEGSRVRLCKGAYDEPASVAFRGRAMVDHSYVRCMKVLMAGAGYPMIATHDPRMITIAEWFAVNYGRSADDYEIQMLHGIRDTEQVRLAAKGTRTRVYVPYGKEWYGYFMRRLAERPANIAFFARSLLTRG